MKRVINFILIIALLSVAVNISAADFKFVGAKKCKMCHISTKSGAQYKKWAKASHAKAFQTLKTDKAKEIAIKAGIKVEPSVAPACLSCHSTAFDPKTGKKRTNVDSSLKIEEGVSCESCHGPGSKYKSKSNMTDHDKFLKTGGIVPVKAVCVECHNSKSPTFKPFDYKKRQAEIAHPTPAKP